MFDGYIGMDTTSDTQVGQGMDTRITVFPTRERFESGVSRMLKAGAGQCAVLHMTVRSDSLCMGAVSRRILNLAGNVLRAGLHAGAVAYLGDAEYAVLLLDTDAREAAAYAREMVAAVSDSKVTWDDEVLTLKACIGGVMTGGCRDGKVLLELAEAARALAWSKAGCKVHMLHAPEEDAQFLASGAEMSGYSLARA